MSSLLGLGKELVLIGPSKRFPLNRLASHQNVLHTGSALWSDGKKPLEMSRTYCQTHRLNKVCAGIKIVCLGHSYSPESSTNNQILTLSNLKNTKLFESSWGSFGNERFRFLFQTFGLNLDYLKC